MKIGFSLPFIKFFQNGDHRSLVKCQRLKPVSFKTSSDRIGSTAEGHVGQNVARSSRFSFDVVLLNETVISVLSSASFYFLTFLVQLDSWAKFCWDTHSPLSSATIICLAKTHWNLCKTKSRFLKTLKSPHSNAA